MPRTNDSERGGGCALCNKRKDEEFVLLECLACLREGHAEHAFCNGACFQRHWAVHRDRSLGSGSYDSGEEVKAHSYHSTPTLRATSQPFTPASEKNHQQQQHARGRPSPRMLQYPSVQSPTLPHLGGQGGPHPILATGPAFLRR